MSWVRPRVPLRRLAAASLAVLLAAVLGEWVVGREQALLREQAAEVMRQALGAVRQARITQGLPFSPDDPAKTGIVGEEMSPLVTTLGSLRAKQLSADPAFGGIVVDLLRRAGVRKGDVIAVGLSGSLPGLNIAVLAAASALDVEPIMVSSVGASQWGATDPRFTWLDMERAIREGGVMPFRSAAAAVGGGEGGAFLLEEGKGLAEAAVRRSGLPPVFGAAQVDVVERRMRVYLEQIGDRPIRAFVNVGGASANVGRCDQSRIPPGLVRKLPPCGEEGQGVIHRFFSRGVPVIHLLQVQRLARQAGVTLAGERAAGG